MFFGTPSRSNEPTSWWTRACTVDLKTTNQVFEENFDLFAFVSEAASHPLPHLHGGADDSSSHDRAEVLHHHPPVDFCHQQLQGRDTLGGEDIAHLQAALRHLHHVTAYLIRRVVHPAVRLEVLLDESFNVLVGLQVAQPLPLHQTLEERLQITKQPSSSSVHLQVTYSLL